MADDPVTDIPMVVESVRVHMPTGRHVLLLKEIGLGRILPIWIGQTEVTQAAYERVMGKNPSQSKGTPRPVENVSFGLTLKSSCRNAP